jgi:hypothetical protein
MALPLTPKSSTWSFSLRFPHQNSVGISLLAIRATCSAQLILHYAIVLPLCTAVQTSRNSSICNFISFLLLSPSWFQITSSTANSRALRFSSLHTTDQVSHPHTATSKVLVPHFSIFTFLDTKRHV